MSNKITLHNGDSAKVLKQYPDNHFDSIVTDPPYGIEFLGKEWDKNTGAIEVWQECLRVLKPGGHILAFSAARTYHRLATNLEDIGFEIRDQLQWIYGSGFPKGQDMGKIIEKREGKRKQWGGYDFTPGLENRGTAVCRKCGKGTPDLKTWKGCHIGEEDCPLEQSLTPADNEWAGWKTGLKPAHEPIVMARKPFKGSTIDNVLKHGTGAINIDDTRVNFAEDDNPDAVFVGGSNWNAYDEKGDRDADLSRRGKKEAVSSYSSKLGRYPSNVIMSEEEAEGKEYSKYFYCPKVSRKERHIGHDLKDIHTNGGPMFNPETGTARAVEQQEEYDKYFYCPKVSRKERNAGYDLTKIPTNSDSILRKKESGEADLDYRVEQQIARKGVGNNHPTVKPVALMKYLVTLVTPKGGKVLDPFNGSGSTGMAVKEFGGEYTGIDLDANYIEIAHRRILSWNE